MNRNILNRSHRILNLFEYQDTGLPTILGKLDLQCPFDDQYILRMAICVDGGLIQVPDELEWIRPMLYLALDDQALAGVYHPFIYVTVRHGIVRSQTDDEWHVDGFSTKVPSIPEQNYIWSNKNGTEYVPIRVHFPADFDTRIHNVNHFLQQFVNQDEIMQCEDDDIGELEFALDPERGRGIRQIGEGFYYALFTMA